MPLKKMRRRKRQIAGSGISGIDFYFEREELLPSRMKCRRVCRRDLALRMLLMVKCVHERR